MNSSLHCSSGSAFSVPNYENYNDIFNFERAGQHPYESPSSYCSYDQRYALLNSVPSYMDSYGHSYSSLYSTSSHSSSSYSVMPFPFLHECGNEPGFIRKRNERERLRVRNVNDGYARLREHLPLESSEKRLSKVETLRAAIKYIKYLQDVLKDKDGSEKNKNKEEKRKEKTKEQADTA